MPVPKKKRSKSKKRMKKAQWKIEVPSLSVCTQCSAAVLPHQVCKACGYYKGQQIIQIKVKNPSTQEG